MIIHDTLVVLSLIFLELQKELPYLLSLHCCLRRQNSHRSADGSWWHCRLMKTLTGSQFHKEKNQWASNSTEQLYLTNTIAISMMLSFMCAKPHFLGAFHRHRITWLLRQPRAGEHLLFLQRRSSIQMVTHNYLFPRNPTPSSGLHSTRHRHTCAHTYMQVLMYIKLNTF